MEVSSALRAQKKQMRNKGALREQQRAYETAFQLIDADKDGFLTAYELALFMGESISADEAQDLINEVFFRAVFTKFALK